MIWKLLGVSLLVTITVQSVGAAGTDRVFLDKDSCRTAPSELLQSLYIGWQEYQPYVDLCPVIWENGKPVLYILTPRMDTGGKIYHFRKNSTEKVTVYRANLTYWI
jgi:hypothetical protein